MSVAKLGARPSETDAATASSWARVAGICWLATIVGGMFAERFVRASMITEDPATTIANIVAGEPLYRAALVSHFAATAFYLALTPLMYLLLSPLGRAASMAAACFSVVGCTLWFIAVGTDLAPLTFFGSAAIPQGSHDMTPIVFAMLRLHSRLLLVGMLCFGAQLLMLGLLIRRAAYLPPWIGMIMAVGGAGYLIAGSLAILSPPLYGAYSTYIFLPGQLSEVLLGLWLAVLGINKARWPIRVAEPMPSIELS